MAVTANTNETYDVTTIREDLSEAMASITPTETLLMSTIGSRNVDNTYFEWSEVDLAATGANRQMRVTLVFPTQHQLTLFVKVATHKFQRKS